MDKLEIKYQIEKSILFEGQEVKRLAVEATLQSIIDRVNELSEMMTPAIVSVSEFGDFPTKGHVSVTTEISTVPKRFKAEDIRIFSGTSGYSLHGFKTHAEAQAALELLLNL